MGPFPLNFWHVSSFCALTGNVRMKYRCSSYYLVLPKIFWAGNATACNHFHTDGLHLSRVQPCSSVSSLSHGTFLFDVKSSTWVANNIIVMLMYWQSTLDICIFARFKANCEVTPLRSFANFKLLMSRHRKELRGPPKARDPRPWPIWPMRKSVTAKWLFPNDTLVCDITSCKLFSADHDSLRIFYEPWARNVAISCSESNGNTGDHDRGMLRQVLIMVHVWRVTFNIIGKK